MAFAAITFKIRPGTESQVVEIFRHFKRASSPIVRNENGEEVGWILGTALFLKDDTIVRVIQYEGELEDVAHYMSTQEGVREAEAKLNEFLVKPRDSSTLEGFMEFFHDCSMRSIHQFSVPPHVAAGVLAEGTAQ
jgi:hypothetical protein